jgi:hypothetical protein
MKNKKFKTIVEESDYILDLPLKELKKYEINAEFIMTTLGVEELAAEYFNKEAK